MDRRRFLRPRATDDAQALPPAEPPPYAGGLAPFAPAASAPWDARRAAHLVRRTGFGLDASAVDQHVQTTPADAVAGTVDAALAAGTPPRPYWADIPRPPSSASEAEKEAYEQANREGLIDSRESVVREALGLRHPGSPLRERLAMLWHSVVPVSSVETGNRGHRNYEYWYLLRRHALGRYDELIHEIGRTPSMLKYLDGDQNRVGNPNENFARELLELFTMGITGPDGSPNYTQQDIGELARALTGWTAPNTQLTSVLNPNRFDAGEKTVLGVTGALDYDGAMALIFSARRTAVAHYVARRLYREFVHDIPNEEVVEELAGVLDGADFAIEPAVRALLGSAHFFSDGVLAAKIKSPFEHVVGLLRTTGAADPDALVGRVLRQSRDAGQRPFDPPNVSGWAVGRSWLDTSTLPTRWLTSDDVISRGSIAQDFALSLPNPFDPYLLVDDLADRMISVPVPEPTRTEAVEILLAGIPDYEWNPKASTAPARIRATLQFLARLPEYQLL
ncbi:DUF1800 domain-containing protein [Rubrivirga sp. IMCC43871]|uniref:DUF1800 domain-containing protein n=1 Tax=Rubrivirga sp. IMCC43871 TaxID=3391575 RepID=UPI00398FDB57